MSGVDHTRRLNGLDLFSGIGGISLALEPWVRTIAYCENNKYSQAVLLSRMSEGLLERAPIWDDVTNLSGDDLQTNIDIIFGGFPCQDLSAAGKGAGIVAGERSSLFTEILRLTKEIRPAFVFLENVPAIRTRGLGRVVSGLAGVGYDCRWSTVSAAEVGANHIRKRWFLLAHLQREGLERHERKTGQPKIKKLGLDSSSNVANTKSRRHSGRGLGGRGETPSDRGGLYFGGGCENLADTDSARFEISGGSHAGCDGNQRRDAVASGGSTGDNFRQSWWSVEPDVGRVANGVSSRVDRIKSLGNAVVPLQARHAFLKLLGSDDF